MQEKKATRLRRARRSRLKMRELGAIRLSVHRTTQHIYAQLIAPAGDKVDPSTIKLNGVTIDPAGQYRVTMNSFLASGGDDFPAFNLGTDAVTGQDDLVALVAYLGANDPYTPVAADRITQLP